jgi:hypothetical protein
MMWGKGGERRKRGRRVGSLQENDLAGTTAVLLAGGSSKWGQRI